jgi:hypothetical protein
MRRVAMAAAVRRRAAAELRRRVGRVIPFTVTALPGP